MAIFSLSTKTILIKHKNVGVTLTMCSLLDCVMNIWRLYKGRCSFYVGTNWMFEHNWHSIWIVLKMFSFLTEWISCAICCTIQLKYIQFHERSKIRLWKITLKHHELQRLYKVLVILFVVTCWVSAMLNSKLVLKKTFFFWLLKNGSTSELQIYVTLRFIIPHQNTGAAVVYRLFLLLYKLCSPSLQGKFWL